MAGEAEKTIADPLDISDEDFANLSFEEIEALEAEASKDEDEDDKSDDDTDDKSDDDTSDEEDDSDDDDKGDDTDEDEDDDKASDKDDTGDDDTTGEDEDEDDTKASGKDKSDSKKADSDDAGEVDYKQAYEQLLSPFKANGKDMRVESVEEAVTLMKMGANYNKKMAALKPNLKVVKMLENNGLLDEGKLGFLIDVFNKDEAAIRKLVKESGVKFEDFDDANDGSDYKPKNHKVSDSEVDLDDILLDIKDSPSYSKTMNVVTKVFDEQSREIIARNPSVIKVINEHIELGFYNQIIEAVERERMFGRLTDVSDLEAYKIMGDKINEAGGFKQAKGSESDDDKSSSDKKTSDDTANQEQRRKNRKKSAAHTKTAPAKKDDSDKIDPLDVPDDEFEKMPVSKFL